MKVLVYKMAAVLCAISFLPSAAGIKKADAAEWINLSSWAYSDVSGFVSAGLLPESLSDISEYMRPIKRGEFCELIYKLSASKVTVIGINAYISRFLNSFCLFVYFFRRHKL